MYKIPNNTESVNQISNSKCTKKKQKQKLAMRLKQFDQYWSPGTSKPPKPPTTSPRTRSHTTQGHTRIAFKSTTPIPNRTNPTQISSKSINPTPPQPKQQPTLQQTPHRAIPGQTTSTKNRILSGKTSADRHYLGEEHPRSRIRRRYVRKSKKDGDLWDEENAGKLVLLI